MKFRSRARARRNAVVERRFKVSRMASVALEAVKRPKNACFLLLIGALFFTAGPVMRYVKEHRYFALSEVDVKGTERLEVSGVRSWLGMVEGSSIWNASPRALEENLRRHPAIAGARVRRILPGRLEVEIEERDPTVVVRDARGFFLAATSAASYPHRLYQTEAKNTQGGKGRCGSRPPAPAPPRRSRARPCPRCSRCRRLPAGRRRPSTG